MPLHLPDTLVREGPQPSIGTAGTARPCAGGQPDARRVLDASFVSDRKRDPGIEKTTRGRFTTIRDHTRNRGTENREQGMATRLILETSALLRPLGVVAANQRGEI